jgi:hypothetical protein
MTRLEDSQRGAAVKASSRQPQGDFGRGRDHAPLGSSDDPNLAQNQRGAYRDAEKPEEDHAPAEVPYRPAPNPPGAPGQGERAD